MLARQTYLALSLIQSTLFEPSTAALRQQRRIVNRSFTNHADLDEEEPPHLDSRHGVIVPETLHNLCNCKLHNPSGSRNHAGAQHNEAILQLPHRRGRA